MDLGAFHSLCSWALWRRRLAAPRGGGCRRFESHPIRPCPPSRPGGPTTGRPSVVGRVVSGVRGCTRLCKRARACVCDAGAPAEPWTRIHPPTHEHTSPSTHTHARTPARPHAHPHTRRDTHMQTHRRTQTHARTRLRGHTPGAARRTPLAPQ